VGGVSLLDQFSAQLVLPAVPMPSSEAVEIDVSYGLLGASAEAVLHAQYTIQDASHM
jgi:hypothetical protein